MSIRPVDHQVTVSKAGEISRLHFQDQQKTLINQQSQNNALQSTAEARLKQVLHREEIQKVRLQEKENKEKQQDSRRNNGKGDQRQTPHNGRKDESTGITGASIDIRL